MVTRTTIGMARGPKTVATIAMNTVSGGDWMLSNQARTGSSIAVRSSLSLTASRMTRNAARPTTISAPATT